MTIDELKNLDTSKFTRAADGWSAVSNRAAASRGRVDNEMLGKLRGTQEGDAAKAALRDLDQLSANYRYIHSECGLIRTALSGLAEELAAPQRKLKQALEEAQSLKFTVKSDGSVEYPKTASTPAPLVPTPAAPGAMPSLLKPDSTPDPNHAKAQDIANRIGEAIKEATEIDGRYARALAKLNTDGNLKNTDLKDVASDVRDVRAAAGKHFSDSKIPKGKSPKENAQWWKNLPQAERDEYTALYPASIGALDGLPATVRDEANRTVLAEAQLDVAQQIKKHEDDEPKKYEQKYNPHTGLPQGVKQTTREWDEWNEKRKILEERQKGMKAIEARFERTGDRGLPEAYLLGIDTEGRGHAIIANGNPDTARHTGVYVPGTGARLGDIQNGMGRAESLWRASAKIDPANSVSTISWYGYDAPRTVEKDAPFRHYADDAAPAVNQFFAGLNAAHEPGPHHTTVVAHSYGTVVTGSAARQGTLPVDDVVFAGSPGAQVGRASEMDVPAGHVWNERAEGDGAVGTWGQFSHGKREWHWRTGVDFVVPSDRRFGANQMATDTEGHGGYWDYDNKTDVGSLSIKNQARVITGHYDEVELKNDVPKRSK
ncbi:alpha/beta hydrolase [Streptomyces cinnamoneus]|uniref:alpha/beta hydrolase n=1 Tax=Streptomyces cinnamoneus TaxID=53446 RepID=UPI0033D1BDA3